MIAAERIKQLLSYDQDTGIFVWNMRRGKALAGAVAGCLDKEGYTVIQIDGRQYRAARLAWFVSNNTWPDVVDHKNRVRNDDRLVNLRCCNVTQNNLNKTRKKGLAFQKGAYVVRIRVKGFRLYIGRFRDEELAELVAAEARVKYHGEFSV